MTERQVLGIVVRGLGIYFFTLGIQQVFSVFVLTISRYGGLQVPPTRFERILSCRGLVRGKLRTYQAGRLGRESRLSTKRIGPFFELRDYSNFSETAIIGHSATLQILPFMQRGRPGRYVGPDSLASLRCLIFKARRLAMS